MTTPAKLFTIEEWAKKTGQRPEAIYALMSSATKTIKPVHKPGDSRVYIDPESVPK